MPHSHRPPPLSAHSTVRFCSNPMEMSDANMMMPVLRMGQPPIHSSLSASVALLSMMALQIEEKAVSLIWL